MVGRVNGSRNRTLSTVKTNLSGTTLKAHVSNSWGLTVASTCLAMPFFIRHFFHACHQCSFRQVRPFGGYPGKAKKNQGDQTSD